ncbi:hypothetical protein EST38_g3080 [Candolleomyces aberdarensis]|uniref:Uncharacterized protein n=1 Tax=Candolleomyces aberdarensis TaxID=2316362 RepID=A0A4V1Q4P2_9AGAR|nr:hypothetical protein EST38_g3080 [Candolleomyces aberdarensis]
MMLIYVEFFTVDISPLQHLHHKLLTANRLRTHPSKTQTSELSSVQRLVKEARKQIIDPVLVRFPPPSPCSSDDELEEPVDPETLKRQCEHEKIKELKKMKIRTTTSGMRLPGRLSGVFIRHDVEDESMDVDISEEIPPPHHHHHRLPPPPTTPSRRQEQGYHYHADGGGGGGVATEDPAGPRPGATSVVVAPQPRLPRSPTDDITSTPHLDRSSSVPAHATKALPTPSALQTRTRRSSRKNANVAVSSSIATDGSRPVRRGKVQVDDKVVLPPPSTSSTSTSTSPSDSSAPISLPTAASGGGGGRGGGGSGSSKPKPETYKQAWSVSEQHLLEQLLEEIPDGEKFRWQKISRAMGGKRTPRQVASRVQKYFEKLKRFGVG